MTISRAKRPVVAAVLAILAGYTVPIGPVCAQMPAPAPVPDGGSGRDASFLPPVSIPQIATPPATPATAPIASGAPLVITAPVSQPASQPPQQPAATAPALVSPPPSLAPVATTAPAVAPIPASALPPAPVAPATPAAIAKPVETATIANVDPESIGLLAKNDGGLGADMWRGTSKAFVAKLLTVLNLPTLSPALNHLAQRLLLTTASVPEGALDGNQSLTSLRVEKLLMLGDVQDAWKLSQLAKTDPIDEITMRLLAEDALISPVRDDACTQLPDIVKIHNGAEWQKLLLVCQLRASDAKAAQVTLDLMHAQSIKDETYFYVAEKNIMGGNKQLPRQLTPLRPLTLALLRQTDMLLPSEIYVHPDAALIPELLASKSREDMARMNLAEHAAERGLISSDGLSNAYRSVTFTPDVIASAANSPESGERLHALLYQAALQDKSPQSRIEDAVKYVQTATPALMAGSGGAIAAEMTGDVQASPDYNAASGFMAHVYILAGKNDAALEWLKQAHHASAGMPAVTAELESFWPLVVFAGLEPDADYANDLAKWCDAFLKNTPAATDARARRDQAASILLLLDADGFTVPTDIWPKVMDTAVSEKHMLPSALFFDRLRAASTSPRKGETVLLALALAGNGSDISLLSAVDITRALRMAGLGPDATSFAKEQAALLLATPAKP